MHSIQILPSHVKSAISVEGIIRIVNTRICREAGYVANTRFGIFLRRYDADKWDLTQTLRRYLLKKMVSGASAPNVPSNIVIHLEPPFVRVRCCHFCTK